MRLDTRWDNFIAQQLKGKGRIAEISGLKGSSPAIERNRGFMDALKAFPGIKVVSRRYADWLKQKGEDEMDSIIARDMPINYVFAQNDRMAIGALQATEKHKIKE